MTTIRQIAREAGVSVGTVSNVLNDNDNVALATRERVQLVIQQHNYRPSNVARSLSTRRTGTLGLIVSNISNPFSSELARGAIETAQQASHGLLVLGAAPDGLDLPTQVETLVRQWVDGILITSEPLADSRISQLPCGDTPLVMMDYGQPPHRNVIGLINFDWEAAGYAATSHLLQLGHCRIGYIGGIADHPSSRLRAQGYHRALRAMNIAIDPTLECGGDFLATGGYQVACMLLAMPNPPTAIVTANDLMALGALQAIAESGLQTPNHISLVGMDDIPYASFLSPPLTTIHLPSYRAGQIGIQMLLEADRTHPTLQRILLPTHLVERRSTAFVPHTSR
ncbi:ribose operon transcriptional repressor RbsR [soil metagenome]